MKKLNEAIRKYDLKPHRYQRLGKVTVVDTASGRYAVKENKQDQSYIYQYLDSRNFRYYPSMVSSCSDDYLISAYEENYDLPEEQRMADMIDLVSLLHSKTTHFKEVDSADYKEIYEDIQNNIEYLYSYYSDMITVIESHIYMSPSEYLLARNISKIFSALRYAKAELENWYELVKDVRKQRLVVVHNNLELSHFIRNEHSYLLSWDKSKIDMPIFDLYKLYLKHGLDYDFLELLKRYEKNYPLQKAERMLLFILITLPEPLSFSSSEYENCKKISRQIDLLYKTEILLSPYYSKQEQNT